MEYHTIEEKVVDRWPLLLALATLWIIVGVCLSSSLSLTNGHVSYTLDDAYIHMAMAKNLVQHGVYGVTQFEFSSSSSSPLWTLFLAGAFTVFGVREWLPFFLNLLLASAVLVLMDNILRSVSSHKILTAAALLSVVLFTPFPALIFGGMEHPLHIILLITFIWMLTKIIVGNELSLTTSHIVWLCLLVIGITMARFESYALVFLGCFFLILRKKWRYSLGLALAAIIPLLLYQYISVSKGWFWLPNSIIIRTDPSQIHMFNSQQAFVFIPFTGGLSGFFSNFVRNATYANHLVVLILCAMVLLVFGWRQMKSLWTMGNIFLLLFILFALVHMQFAKNGHFFRYEAYLVALGFFVLAYALSELHREISWRPFTWRKTILGVVVLILMYFGSLPLLFRCKISIELIPRATCNIYEQQYQMGLFLKHFYPEASVAANDIGAISFLGDIHLLDLVGLASIDVLTLKKEGRYTTEQISQLSRTRDVDVAIVYDPWFRLENLQGVPPEWIKVAEWVIQDNVVCGGSVVSFYAVKAAEKERLISNLHLFSFMLPPTVGQAGYHMMIKNSPDTAPVP
jgi:hypothetical protein